MNPTVMSEALIQFDEQNTPDSLARLHGRRIPVIDRREDIAGSWREVPLSAIVGDAELKVEGDGVYAHITPFKEFDTNQLRADFVVGADKVRNVMSLSSIDLAE